MEFFVNFPRPAPQSRHAEDLGVGANARRVPVFGRILLWLSLAIEISPALAATSTPYLGAPHSVPGRIEAEHFDRGGEGAGYHFSGHAITEDDFAFPHEISRERPGEDILLVVLGSEQAVLQTSEWLQYTIECRQSGYYSLQLKTLGPPQYYVYVDQDLFGPKFESYPTLAFLHMELDGEQISGLVEVGVNIVCSRVWLTEGIHHLRLIMDSVPDARLMDQGYHQGWFLTEPWTRYTVAVDWIQLVPAAMPLRVTSVAGGEPGFADGVGAEARFGLSLGLEAQWSTGELVIMDPINAAIRLFSLDGTVRTLAGHPGNPPRDGFGTNAGFGSFVDTVVNPDDSLLVLEQTGTNQNQIRRVEPSGSVTTIYAGRPTVTLPDFRPDMFGGQTITREVPLTRIVPLDSGEIAIVGTLDDYYLNFYPGPQQIPFWTPYTRHIWFRLLGGRLEASDLQGPEPPPSQPADLGGGIRLPPRNYQLVAEDSPGFPQTILPEISIASAIRSREGVLLASPFDSRVVRLDPDESLFWLSIQTTGDGGGGVEGVPQRFLRPDEEIVLKAVPGGRFSVFEGWSDGDLSNPRVVRIARDLHLTARFVLRLPSPLGILPGSLKVGPDGHPRFTLVGDANPYLYRIERSTNLVNWNVVVGRPFAEEGLVSGTGNSLYVWSPTALIQVLRGRSDSEYYRAILLSR